MRTVDLKALKRKFREYVRFVATGDVVLVTERGRVIAELRPPQTERTQMALDAMTADAISHGWVTVPLVAANGIPPRKPTMSYRELMNGLAHDRG